MTIVPGIVLPDSDLGRICQRYQIKELSIFGSAVRGENRSDSDLDMLVDFLPDASVSLFQHAAAERELSELLGHKVDLVSKRALRSGLRDEVLAQARVVYAA